MNVAHETSARSGVYITFTDSAPLVDFVAPPTPRFISRAYFALRTYRLFSEAVTTKPAARADKLGAAIARARAWTVRRTKWQETRRCCTRNRWSCMAEAPP